MQESHLVRDLVQARLLGSIFSHSLRGEIALKGGFAMRVLANSHRYTDDIDLAASPGIPAQFVGKCIQKALSDLRGSGLVANLTVSENPKQTDTTLKWKINGTVGNHSIHLKVEVSRRDHVDGNTLVTSPYSAVPGSPPVMVSSVGLPSLAAAKVDCLKNPKREAPRDVYDLYLLVSMDVRPVPGALQRYSREELLALRSLVWDKMEKMDYETARQQLVPFLPAETADKLTEDVWDEMRLVVADKIAEWVDEELEGCASVTPSGVEHEEVAARAP